MDGVIVKLYSPDLKKKVRINNVEYFYKDAPNKTELIKLPTAKKKRSEILNGALKPEIFYECEEQAKELLKLFHSQNFLKDKEQILEFIKNKTLIPNEEIDWSFYDQRCEEKDSIYYVKRCPSETIIFHNHLSSTRNIDWERLFLTYEDCLKWTEDYLQERKRLSELTDEEFVKEECAATITKYMILYLRIKDEDINKKIHKTIMEHLENFLNKSKINWDDIELRLFGGKIEYKKVENKKWNDLVKDIDSKLYSHLKNYLEGINTEEN